MYPIGYFLAATAKVLEIVLELYMWIIIIRALLSWVNPDPYNPIVQFLHSITDPVMYRVRRLLPMSGMGIDFSPIVVILGIIFLQTFLVNTIARLAMQLQ
ncbi:MAG: YggT family protein [Nitrospinota bacterium]|nr:YggT family protein [Nitrospinota bacterium]